METIKFISAKDVDTLTPDYISLINMHGMYSNVCSSGIFFIKGESNELEILENMEKFKRLFISSERKLQSKFSEKAPVEVVNKERLKCRDFKRMWYMYSLAFSCC